MPNAAPNHAPSPEGFVVEVGGQFNSEYGSLTAALRAGLALKSTNAQAQVKVYDAKERA